MVFFVPFMGNPSCLRNSIKSEPTSGDNISRVKFYSGFAQGEVEQGKKFLF